ncbi:M18 family aminopeptidase [methane-oxidizing endosymbiont of Gigantopelta aegis]|uniref:M18 family aminopeptidase n=1 Tax=methane-oxidizing endosymbiont of Gigantopelta aegis TaxID=2794938 RepID=UPI001FDA888D|nr:M18 family aminopeptidase [methane-oxidizing endosymbiont of Gigantopelta aegis]
MTERDMTQAQTYAQQLLDFIDASPSPWHAVDSMVTQLQQAGFKPLLEAEPWPLQQGGRYYVIRDGSSLIAFVVGDKPLTETGFKMVGAHTDSPGLRVKPKPVITSGDLVRLGVEIYGGPILATFSDRDLSLAGRISYKAGAHNIAVKNICFERPLLRLPNLAIHMNRQVNEEGLKLHKQNELPLLIAEQITQELGSDYFAELLAEQAGLMDAEILSWELNVYDTQKGTFWGDKDQFIANSQLDNLASCHAALVALLDDDCLNSGNTLVCAFFDHEEIGSESHKGADSAFLTDSLKRMALAVGVSDADFFRVLAQSFLISADMAHAWQPNFANAYEPEHKVLVNQGPVIKHNANQRYTSESLSSALFIECCQQAGVSWQHYSHRCDIPCGSTIGPMLSARLGVRSIDIGNPMWAMHSIRESAGVFDHRDLIHVLRSFYRK